MSTPPTCHPPPRPHCLPTTPPNFGGRVGHSSQQSGVLRGAWGAAAGDAEHGRVHAGPGERLEAASSQRPYDLAAQPVLPGVTQEHAAVGCAAERMGCFAEGPQTSGTVSRARPEEASVPGLVCLTVASRRVQRSRSRRPPGLPSSRCLPRPVLDCSPGLTDTEGGGTVSGVCCPTQSGRVPNRSVWRGLTEVCVGGRVRREQRSRGRVVGIQQHRGLSWMRCVSRLP